MLIVPFKRGKAGYTKADAIRLMAEQRGETQAEIRDYLSHYGSGGGLAVAMRAEGVSSGLSEGGLVYLMEGTIPGSGWEHLGEIVYFHPADDLRWKEAAIMDEYAEIVGPVTELNFMRVLD